MNDKIISPALLSNSQQREEFHPYVHKCKIMLSLPPAYYVDTQVRDFSPNFKCFEVQMSLPIMYLVVSIVDFNSHIKEKDYTGNYSSFALRSKLLSSLLQFKRAVPTCSICTTALNQDA